MLVSHGRPGRRRRPRRAAGRARGRRPAARRGGRGRSSPAAARTPTWRIPPPSRLRQHPGLVDRGGVPTHQRADRGAEALGEAHREHVARSRRTPSSGVPVATWAFQIRAPSRCTPTPRSSAHAAQRLQVVERRAPRRRRSCGCSRPRPPWCGTKNGPMSGANIASIAARSTCPPGATQVRVVSPVNAPWAPSSARSDVRARPRRAPPRRGRPASAHREHVGHRPGRREQRRLLAEQPGDPLLERVDGRVLAVHVVADLGARPSPPASPVGRPGDACRERRSIMRGGRRWASRAASPRPGTPAPATARGSAAGRRPTRSGGRGRPRRSSSPPPTHSVTSSPVSSTCTPPGQVPSARCTSKKPCTSSITSSKRRVL